jgi:hypothetical protein
MSIFVSVIILMGVEVYREDVMEFHPLFWFFWNF